MRKSRKIIGICGSYLFNQIPVQFIKQLRHKGLKYEYCITALSCSSNSPEDTADTLSDKELINLIRHIPLSGLVVLTDTIKNPTLLNHILNICQEKEIPVFSVDGQLEGCYNMLMDNVGGFEQMVRHVIEFHGCRTVNMLAGFKDDPFSEERIRVYKEVLTKNHIPIEEERIGYGDFWDRPTRKAVQGFLQSSLTFPEAIVCANDSMAIAACAELQKFGYNVPEDVIITGFDGIQSGQYHFPVLTTCEPDFSEAASFIVQELESFHIHKSFTPCDHPIHYLPKIQQSCGCELKTIHNLNHVVSTLYENSGDSAWHNISMNNLITANLYNDNIETLTKLLPEHVHLWKSHFRFACVKASMLSSCRIEDSFDKMVSILNLRDENFSTNNEIFSIEDFIPDIDTIKNTDTLFVKLLNSGETVYGYSVEGFHELDDRSMQRCNDFAFFLSYCLNTIVHNAKQKELTDGLLKANREISMMSVLDSLTGLYNRRGFYHEIENWLHNIQNLGKYLYIFSIDMNRLKFVNDNYGHAEGDFAITTLAKAIRYAGKEDSICARFGGDEFIVASLYDSQDAYSTDEFRKRMFDSIHETERLIPKPYPIEASVGLACQQITATINVESMIATADEYMYQMKQNRK